MPSPQLMIAIYCHFNGHFLQKDFIAALQWTLLNHDTIANQQVYE